MKRKNPPMFTRHEKLLREAISSHDFWRGELVGAADPEAQAALAEYDSHTARMRQALRELLEVARQHSRERYRRCANR